MNIPVDAESVQAPRELESFCWPVTPEEYRRLGNAVTDLVFSFFGFDSSEPFATAFRLVSRNILKEFFFLSYSLLTTERIRRAGKTFLATDQYRYFRSIRNGFDGLAPLYRVPDRTSIVSACRATALDYTDLLRGDSFVLGANPLCKQYISQHHMAPRFLRWHLKPFTFSQTPGLNTRACEQAADGLCVSLFDIWERHDMPVRDDVVSYVRRAVQLYFATAVRDMGQSYGLGTKAGKTLLVGTGGKYANRLMAYYFMRDEGTVVRFDHGGDRALFLDNWWGINEFAFQNVFVTYGPALARRLQYHTEAGNILMPPPEKAQTEITGMVPSALYSVFRKHINSRAQRVKKVMVLLPTFIGDIVHPGYVPPDIIYLKVIWKTVQCLKNHGYHIVIKKHPKAQKSIRFGLFDGCADEINSGFFADAYGRADAFVFFYLGSAFAEAAMTLKPIVFINLPYRIIDPEVRAALEKSLCFVDCTQTEDVHVDFSEMIQYLSRDFYDMTDLRLFLQGAYMEEQR